jgi:hypothetical protein
MKAPKACPAQVLPSLLLLVPSGHVVLLQRAPVTVMLKPYSLLTMSRSDAPPGERRRNTGSCPGGANTGDQQRQQNAEGHEQAMPGAPGSPSRTRRSHEALHATPAGRIVMRPRPLPPYAFDLMLQPGYCLQKIARGGIVVRGSHRSAPLLAPDSPDRRTTTVPGQDPLRSGPCRRRGKAPRHTCFPHRPECACRLASASSRPSRHDVRAGHVPRLPGPLQTQPDHLCGGPRN